MLANFTRWEIKDLLINLCKRGCKVIFGSEFDCNLPTISVSTDYNFVDKLDFIITIASNDTKFNNCSEKFIEFDFHKNYLYDKMGNPNIFFYVVKLRDIYQFSVLHE